MKTMKIVGIGACVLDTLMTVPYYPAEDTKLRASERRQTGGGPAATGVTAAARLGIPSGFLGALPDSTDGAFLLRDFEKYGVCTEAITKETDGRPFTSVILLSERDGTRTCVFEKGDLPPLSLNEKQRQAIREASLLLIDGNEIDAAEQACRIARENGVCVVYDCGGLYAGVERLLRLSDYLIPSEEFALAHTGATTAQAAAEELMRRYAPHAVIVTQGKNGGILLDGTGCRRYPAFPVNVVDSNGSGDVFHGAFSAAHVRGYGDFQAVLYASATAALKCRGIGSRESVPDHETVIRFLKENGYEF